MIVFDQGDQKAAVRKMWKTCFDEQDSFLDLFFERRYKKENTLLKLEKSTPAASLQILPVSVNGWGRQSDCAYLAGVCTLPAFRKSGLMKELLAVALNTARERGDLLATLIPQNPWLFEVYQKSGFYPVFSACKATLTRTEMENSARNTAHSSPKNDCKAEDIYTSRHALLSAQNYAVLLSFEDFAFAVDESLLFGGHLLSVGERGWALTMQIGKEINIRELVAEKDDIPLLCKTLLVLYPKAQRFHFTMPAQFRDLFEKASVVPLGMARIVNTDLSTRLFAQANPQTKLCLEITDQQMPQNSGIFTINNREAQRGGRPERTVSIEQATALFMDSLGDTSRQAPHENNRLKIKPYINLLLN